MDTKVGFLIALCGIVTVLSEPITHKCYPLMIPICQGYGYFWTSHNLTEQMTVSTEIDEVRKFDNLSPGTSPIHIPYLCYALAPKCRRSVSYDVRPCKEACKQFVNETSEAEIMALRGWEGWTSKLKCSTFKLRKEKSRCVPYKKLLRYAQAKPSSAIPANSRAMLGGFANSNKTLDELLAASEAMAEISANMANQTDMDAMMDSVNQMMELANSISIPLPDRFDPENLEALMNSGAGPDMAAKMNSMNQMRETYNSMNIPIPEDMNPETWARIKQEFGIE